MHQSVFLAKAMAVGKHYEGAPSTQPADAANRTGRLPERVNDSEAAGLED